ncbi:hypothetical protein WJX72_004166 [[Myrmecia] bisecta]|uniref:HMG domain-containing protein n=1 Tax=[Myrmecia] bisecta TaxID=41462 RepID=A0AAW1PCV2_9CHLO
MAQRPSHMMAVPMAFKPGPDPLAAQQPLLVGCYFYLCDCKELADWHKVVKLCLHARLVAELHDDSLEQLNELEAGDLYTTLKGADAIKLEDSQKRAAGKLGGGLLPSCNSCLQSGAAACCHCVPHMPCGTSAGGTCPDCGHTWSELDPVAEKWIAEPNAKLLTLNTATIVTVYYRRCGNRACSGRLEYDGLEDAIFNYSNQTLLTYELAYEYTDGMCLTRLPFATHHNLMRTRYNRTGTRPLLCLRTTHRLALMAFLRQLDIPYGHRCSCPICSELPHEQLVLIVDGKAMGINKTFARPYVALRSASDAVFRTSSKHNDLVPVPNQRARTLLHRWADGGASAADLSPALTPDEYREMRTLLARHARALVEALDGMVAELGGNTPRDNLTPALRNDLLHYFPVLQQVIARTSWWAVPTWFQPLLRSLGERAQAVRQFPMEPADPVADPSAEADHVYMPAYLLQGGRGLPRFHADARADEDSERERCTKHVHKHPKLTVPQSPQADHL